MCHASCLVSLAQTIARLVLLHDFKLYFVATLPEQAINTANGAMHACTQQACWTTVQGVFLLVAGGPGLGLWGADAASAMRPDAWTYLSIRGLGAPFTVIMLVLQVLIALFYPLPNASMLWFIRHCPHQHKGEVLLHLFNACIV